MAELVNSRMVQGLKPFFVSWDYFGGHSLMVGRGSQIFQSSDFFNSADESTTPFLGQVAEGASAEPGDISDQKHPGVVRLLSSTTINSTFKYRAAEIAGADMHLVGPGDGYEVVFRPAVLTNSIYRFGYMSDNGINGPIFDGVFMQVASGNINGRVAKSSSESLTATNYALSVDTWYRAQLFVNEAGDGVTFFLYSEAGALLWSDSVAVDAGHNYYSSADVTAGSTGTTAQVLMHLDYAAFWTLGLAR